MPDRFVFTAADGYALVGSRFEAERPKGAVVINSATGVPRGFYRRYAQHLAASGYTTLTYDYRGIGDSRPASLREVSATMSDWGRLDMAAALSEARKSSGALPIFVVGHSIGGQLLGLVNGIGEVAGIATVGVSTGVWWRMSGSYRLFCALVWYGLVPVSTALVGYAAASKFGQGEDLPAGVAREWSAWCRRGSYFVGHLPDEELAQFSRVTAPWLSLGFSDDPIANPTTNAELLALYPNAAITRQFFTPQELGEKRVGHFGFFSAKLADRLWPRHVAFFDSLAAAA